MNYHYAYYHPTKHFFKRYRKRMSEHIKGERVKERLLDATPLQLTKRANFMLVFSTHGRPGHSKHTEVRYYFDWDIVVDNRAKTIITMYINKERRIPPVRLFGDSKLRRMLSKLWFGQMPEWYNVA